MKVGIPKGLFYYKYSLLWNTFFTRLGINLVLSAETNQAIINNGISACINDACMPVKAYIGHVMDIYKEVDVLFIPRYTSISKKEYICPMSGGLPNLVKSSVKNLPLIIDTEINMRKKHNGGLRAVIDIGEKLGFNKSVTTKAYKAATNAYIQDRIQKIGKLLENKYSNKNNLKILLIGHPYTVYDKFLNMNIVQKLQEQNADVMTLESFDSRILRCNSKNLDKPMFWNYGTKALGCTYTIKDLKDIDGVIFISYFGCGGDSFVGYMIERRVREQRIPFMSLSLDEHTGEAGLNTRIEAFIDTINWRKKDK